MKAPQSTMKEFIDKSRVNVIKDSDKFENSIKTEEIIRHHTFFFHLDTLNSSKPSESPLHRQNLQFILFSKVSLYIEKLK